MPPRSSFPLSTLFMFFGIKNDKPQDWFCAVSALELSSTCKLANLTVKAELGCCLLHRSGRLTIDGCILQCESNPLDYLSCPIVSTAGGCKVLSSSLKANCDGVSVIQTRIEGGAKAVLTKGDLALQRVRVIYAQTSVYFWFDVEHP
uniref:F-box protein SKIP5 n=1 Tax=Rhizophora mucronata TaxID=61149 RepID=A0A2P2K5F7_RHIMU